MHLFLIIISCKTNKKPDYVIPHDKMVDIIVDIHLADGMLTLNNIRRDLVLKDTINIYNEILKYHGYSRKDFDTSLYYYTKNIADYDKIYEEVLNRLNEKETKLKEAINKEQENDSLQ